MSRQRSVRMGNVRVASATVASMSQRFARRTPSTRSRALTPCSAQARSPSVTRSPTTHAQRDAELRSGAGGAGAGLKGEGNEVADFFDEGAQRVAGRLLRDGAELLGALQRAFTTVLQRADVDDPRLARRGRRGGWRGRRGRPLPARDELVQRRGAGPPPRPPPGFGPGARHGGALRGPPPPAGGPRAG